MASFQIDRFQYVPGIHHGKEIIWIHFPYNAELKNHLREHKLFIILNVINDLAQ
ncbi:MAG: hypothetical protein M9959_15315 [Chitinophagaceae bacterium]|nr:hypothetical protein [Chitinophagaceae bacterium]